MAIKEMGKQYLDGEITAIHFIRTLSGMFNPKYAIGLPTLIYAITRVEEGDLDKEMFWRVYLQQNTDEYGTEYKKEPGDENESSNISG